MNMAEFRYSIIKNPEIFMENRLPAHSDHAYYRSEESALAGCSDFRESLNGIWKFSYAKNISSAIVGFEKEDYDCRTWDDIRVPAHIQMEGYDTPTPSIHGMEDRQFCRERFRRNSIQ